MAVEAGGIGARLRAGREKLGLTVLQVAERIHTDPKIVEAIEAENFEALGAPVYARGHIGHYAELVGESGSELNQLYSNVSKVAQPDLTRIVKAPAGIDSNKLVAPALLVIAVFAVAGAIWWVSALSKKEPQLSETHVVGEEAPAPGTSPPAAAPAGESTATSGAQTGAPLAPADRGPSGAMAMQPRPGSTAGTAPGPSRPEATASAGVPPASARSANAGSGGAGNAPSHSGTAGLSASTSTPARSASGKAPVTTSASSRSAQATLPGARTASSGAAPASSRTAAAHARTAAASPAPAPTAAVVGTEPASATPAAVPPRAKNQSQVTLRYSADSWTEVYDASGARLFYDVGAADSVQTVVGTPPLRVVLGNASGVSVEFNGHSKAIANLSRPDGSVQFSINRSGQVVRAKPVADGG
jgi:cytoskeletal protein RodZ